MYDAGNLVLLIRTLPYKCHLHSGHCCEIEYSNTQYRHDNRTSKRHPNIQSISPLWECPNCLILEDPLAILYHSRPISTIISSRNKQILQKSHLASNNIFAAGNYILKSLLYHYQMLK